MFNRINGGNGFYGSHHGRSIPLGVRIFPQKHSKIFELHHRYIDHLHFNTDRLCRAHETPILGWVAVLAWQTGITSIAFLTASQIQSLLIVLDPHYIFQQWHATLLIIAVTVLALFFNTILVKRLPLVETIALVLHIVGFFAILITLWVLAPRNSAKVVFTQFTDGGGWGNIGLSTLIGLLSPIFAFIGPDSATHLSEEIRDASLVLPQAMMATTFLNGLLGFIMLITFCFCLGDINTILANPQVQPYVLVFQSVTKSNAGTAILSTILIVLTFCGCVSNMATASRQLFAFARDNGVPFSSFLSRVS